MSAKKKTTKVKPSPKAHNHGAVERLSTALVPHLSDDLLKPKLRKQKPKDAHATWGHCYVATEALYHVLGGSASGYTPASGRDQFGIVHWWLECDTDQGIVRIDVTAAQYTHAGVEPPYEVGKRKGFVPSRDGDPTKPSNRAQTLITRLFPEKDPWKDGKVIDVTEQNG